MAGDSEAAYEVADFCASLTSIAAMNPDNPQLSGLRRDDPNLYRKAIGLALIRLTEQLNVTNTLNTTQMADLTVKIGTTFYYLRFEEVLYVLEKGANGEYGKDYNRLDSSVIMDWFEKYDVNERTPKAVELAANRQEKPNKPLSMTELGEFLERSQVKINNPFVDKSHLRSTDDDAKKAARTAQSVARERYIAEKAAGIVNDYSTPDPDATR